MTLVACAECGHRISTKAVSCPQCGHPPDPAPASEQPTCHSCPAAATSRCQNCDKFACVVHLYPIYVRRGKRGTNEIRCAECHAQAEESNAASRVIGWFGLVIVAIVVFTIIAKSNSRAPAHSNWPTMPEDAWDSK
jgi:hypothetical protein